MLHITCSLKQCETITHSFFFFFEKQTHTQAREKGVLTQKHTTTSLKSHGNIGALLIVSTNGLMLLYARQICLGSRCVKTC